MAGVGTKLSTALMCYAGGVADADKNMTAIAGDVALTSDVLASVGDILKQREDKAVATPSAVKDARAILTRCHDTFEEISCLINRKDGTDVDGKRRGSKRAQLIWPIKSNKAELFKSRLESLKSSLMLLLQVLSFAKDWAGGTVAAQSVTERCDVIRDLHYREQKALETDASLEQQLEAVGLDRAEDINRLSATSLTPFAANRLSDPPRSVSEENMIRAQGGFQAFTNLHVRSAQLENIPPCSITRSRGRGFDPPGDTIYAKKT
ncbi:hypothetical protein EG328_008646 [Venturia inaequalis]|uniref:Fungal N-terminal domain-containing protein n=1 Tax=Venturia inaequalis TaxID=5025 RepID=A0A8H3YP08_VENIN|nr:hypothetical protein EG328_008646 [Venturia inaequalis]